MATNRQYSLPLTREHQFALLDAIDWRRLREYGIASRSTWRNVCELLRQIEFCGWRDGCRTRAETLAGRCRVSRRTLFRARELAGRAGLLAVDPHYDAVGRTANSWSVDWARVAALVDPDDRLAIDEKLALTHAKLALTRAKLALTHLKELKINQDLIKPPPPSPPRDAGRAGENGRPADFIFSSWDDVAADLRARGVETADRQITSAIRGGSTPDRALAIIAAFDGHPAGLYDRPAAALAYRIASDTPASDPATGWPKPSAAAVRAADRSRIESKIQDREQQRNRILKRHADELARLEPSDRLELARSHFAFEAAAQKAAEDPAALAAILEQRGPIHARN